MFGFININKPGGMTSHDVVSKLRKISKIKQIGHTGTLDPMATGVLPVAIGKASRLIEFLTEDKGYIAKLQFGKISDTYDIEGAVENYSDKKVTQQQVQAGLQKFRGKIEQIPPAYSAVHYKGKRLYELARQGQIPEDIPSRTVFINVLELLEFNEEEQTALLKIECTKGTYIRSIINDLGMELSCGAVMTELKRTKSGLFTIDNAIALDMLTDREDVEKYLINPVEVLSYKCYELTEFEYQKIIHGQSLLTKQFDDNEHVLLVFDNNLCAISQKDDKSQKLITKKVFIQ